MYKIKLKDGRYAKLEQYSNIGVDVYSVSFDEGDYFEDESEAIKISKAINEGKYDNFILYGNKESASIIRYELKILEEKYL